MALSDLILQLGTQAKDLEESASALHADNDAKLKARASELHESLSKIKGTLGQRLEADSDATADRLAGLQRTVSDGFEALRAEAAARTTDPAEQAGATAGQAELDAANAIDFAVHALQEAEYYLLASAAARGNDGLTDAEVTVDGVVVTDGENATADEEPTK
ncbi:hypothetical protein [Leifsonia sp. NPDC058230]|uniref:hypothetical protein n=1 Tax=Leifsonia sp. NPDC058230 TaxID=3346391 RepID=UPI0036DC1845